MPKESWATLSLLLALFFVGAGCREREQRVPVFPVRGAVFADGKPAAKALVIFHPVNGAAAPAADVDAPRPTGEVAADGSFSLSTYTAGDGAPAGEYTITVSWPEGSSSIGGDADAGPDRLGGRYLNPQTSGLRARVNETATDIPPFQLKPR
jgi:hypothetical protein